MHILNINTNTKKDQDLNDRKLRMVDKPGLKKIRDILSNKLVRVEPKTKSNPFPFGTLGYKGVSKVGVTIGLPFSHPLFPVQSKERRSSNLRSPFTPSLLTPSPKGGLERSEREGGFTVGLQSSSLLASARPSLPSSTNPPGWGVGNAVLGYITYPFYPNGVQGKGVTVRKGVRNGVRIPQKGISEGDKGLAKPINFNFKTSYSKMTEIKLITVSLASANRIRQWAEKMLPNGKVVGEVINAETLHYKTFKPIKGGLFCERIFGPTKDHTCACGKKFNLKNYLNQEMVLSYPFIPEGTEGEGVRKLERIDTLGSNTPSFYNPPAGDKNVSPALPSSNLPFFLPETVKGGGIIKKGDLVHGQTVTDSKNSNVILNKNIQKRYFCRGCDVEYTYSTIRRTQLGYIQLATPVTHVWYVKGVPNYMSILLDMRKKDLHQIIYNYGTLTFENALKGKQLVNVKPSDLYDAWIKVAKGNLPPSPKSPPGIKLRSNPSPVSMLTENISLIPLRGIKGPSPKPPLVFTSSLSLPSLPSLPKLIPSVFSAGERSEGLTPLGLEGEGEPAFLLPEGGKSSNPLKGDGTKRAGISSYPEKNQSNKQIKSIDPKDFYLFYKNNKRLYYIKSTSIAPLDPTTLQPRYINSRNLTETGTALLKRNLNETLSSKKQKVKRSWYVVLKHLLTTNSIKAGLTCEQSPNKLIPASKEGKEGLSVVTPFYPLYPSFIPFYPEGGRDLAKEKGKQEGIRKFVTESNQVKREKVKLIPEGLGTQLERSPGYRHAAPVLYPFFNIFSLWEISSKTLNWPHFLLPKLTIATKFNNSTFFFNKQISLEKHPCSLTRSPLTLICHKTLDKEYIKGFYYIKTKQYLNLKGVNMTKSQHEPGKRKLVSADFSPKRPTSPQQPLGFQTNPPSPHPSGKKGDKRSFTPSNPFYSKSKGVSPSLRSPALNTEGISLGKEGKDKLEVKIKGGLGELGKANRPILGAKPFLPSLSERSFIPFLSPSGDSLRVKRDLGEGQVKGKKSEEVVPARTNIILPLYILYNTKNQVYTKQIQSNIAGKVGKEAVGALPLTIKTVRVSHFLANPPFYYSPHFYNPFLLTPLYNPPLGDKSIIPGGDLAKGEGLESSFIPFSPSNPFYSKSKGVSPSLRSPALLFTPRGLGKKGKDKLEVKTEGGIRSIKKLEPLTNKERMASLLNQSIDKAWKLLYKLGLSQKRNVFPLVRSLDKTKFKTRLLRHLALTNLVNYKIGFYIMMVQKSKKNTSFFASALLHPSLRLNESSFHDPNFYNPFLLGAVPLTPPFLPEHIPALAGSNPSLGDGKKGKDKLEVKTERGLAHCSSLWDKHRVKRDFVKGNIADKLATLMLLNLNKKYLNRFLTKRFALPLLGALPLTDRWGGGYLGLCRLPKVSKGNDQVHVVMGKQQQLNITYLYPNFSRTEFGLGGHFSPSNPFYSKSKGVSPSLRSPALNTEGISLGKKGKDKLEVKTEGGSFHYVPLVDSRYKQVKTGDLVKGPPRGVRAMFTIQKNINLKGNNLKKFVVALSLTLFNIRAKDKLKLYQYTTRLIKKVQIAESINKDFKNLILISVKHQCLNDEKMSWGGKKTRVTFESASNPLPPSLNTASNRTEFLTNKSLLCVGGPFYPNEVKGKGVSKLEVKKGISFYPPVGDRKKGVKALIPLKGMVQREQALTPLLPEGQRGMLKRDLVKGKGGISKYSAHEPLLPLEEKPPFLKYAFLLLLLLKSKTNIKNYLKYKHQSTPSFFESVYLEKIPKGKTVFNFAKQYSKKFTVNPLPIKRREIASYETSKETSMVPILQTQSGCTIPDNNLINMLVNRLIKQFSVSSVNKPNPPSNPFALPVKRVSPSLRSPALNTEGISLGKKGKDKLEVKTEGGIKVRGFAPSNNADNKTHHTSNLFIGAVPLTPKPCRAVYSQLLMVIPGADNNRKLVKQVRMRSLTNRRLVTCFLQVASLYTHNQPTSKQPFPQGDKLTQQVKRGGNQTTFLLGAVPLTSSGLELMRAGGSKGPVIHPLLIPEGLAQSGLGVPLVYRNAAATLLQPVRSTNKTVNLKIAQIFKNNIFSWLSNNIYCLSHRYVWEEDQEKNWRRFTLYFYPPKSSTATSIPLYKNRNYNELFNFDQMENVLSDLRFAQLSPLNPFYNPPQGDRNFIPFTRGFAPSPKDLVKVEGISREGVKGISSYPLAGDSDSKEGIKGDSFDYSSIYLTQDQKITQSPETLNQEDTLALTHREINRHLSYITSTTKGMNIHTTFSGPGIIQKLLNEFNFTELKKMDKQNRILLFEYNKHVKKLKKVMDPRSLKSRLEYYKACHIRDVSIRRTKLIRKIFSKATPAGVPLLNFGGQTQSTTYLGQSPLTEGLNMILTVLPVLPPDLRPIVKTDGKQATADLNTFYKNIIYRNERLKKFLKDPALNSSFEMKYAQRLVQEAVDNLIQNGKGGVAPIKDARGRLLKSLSDGLKGKQGRFRQYLLGKRVDYSARSVIVVGPRLKLHECGIPKEIALALYFPFLIKRILNQKLALTVPGAKGLIQKKSPLVWQLLREIMKTCPVILNRAPTLHRLGFQAFQPKLVEGKAILLHPLVCPAFNADFDGDQMAVHVPITYEAKAEAWKLMLSRNNLLSPATGEPILLPSQDMVLGCYYLTTNCGEKITKYKRGTGFYFHNINEVLKAYNQQLIDLHALIWVNMTELNFNSPIQDQPLEIRIPTIKYKIDTSILLIPALAGSKLTDRTVRGQASSKGSKKGFIKNNRSLIIYIYSKLHQFVDFNGILSSQIVRTTPGRILFNNMVQTALNKRPKLLNNK